jgi:hypothetical protein
MDNIGKRPRKDLVRMDYGVAEKAVNREEWAYIIKGSKAIGGP